MLLNLILSISILLRLSQSTIYYVNPDNPNLNGAGRQWGAAFLSFERALAIASRGDEIWLIGNQTYIPINASNRSDCYLVPNGVHVYGGFVGTEASIYERPADFHETYPSIISGDIGVEGVHTDNCYHALTYDRNMKMNGVILQHGYADLVAFGEYSKWSTVRHRYAGGLAALSPRDKTVLRLDNVIMRNNTAINGGAMWFKRSSGGVDVHIKNCLFRDNKVMKAEFEGGFGGAIYEYFMTNINITNSTFINNYAPIKGGAVYIDYGGVFSCDGCTFLNNRADGYGGGLFAEDRNSQTDGTFPQIRNTVFEGNYAKIYGGGLMFFNGVDGNFKDVSFIDNHCDGLGGAMVLIDSTANETRVTYSGNVAAGNAFTNILFTDDETKWTEPDPDLSYNDTAEIIKIKQVYNEIYPMTDVVPFETVDPAHVCYVGPTSQIKNGLSWNTAYGKIQTCIDQLSATYNGGEVWVATGTYFPSETPQWKINVGKSSKKYWSIILRDNVRLYGGFAGTETHRDQRDFAANPTYLSCQVTATVVCTQIMNAADGTVVDGFIFKDAGNVNTYRRRQLSLYANQRSLLQEDETTTKNSIDVETVLSSTSTSPGAGIWSNSTDIIIVNSIFLKLWTNGKGAGLYCIGLEGGTGLIKSPTLINVAFLGNRANSRGGAISADAWCHFECKYCVFDHNGCALKGGAIYLDFDADPIFTKSTFTNNYALEAGGCIAADGKSVATFYEPYPFENNHATWDGGCLYSGSGVGQGIEQGFHINTFSGQTMDNLFINNYIDNGPGMGGEDVYMWAYSVLTLNNISEPTVDPTISPSNEPSTSPTPGPTVVPTSSPIIPTPQPTMGPLPNIIFFVTDDMQYLANWTESAPKGTNLQNNRIVYQDIKVPAFDRIRNEGMIFPRTYAGGPKCSPSRYSLLTGRYPSRCAYGRAQTLAVSDGTQGTDVSVPNTRLLLDDKYHTIMQLLKNTSNYYTGIVGKWHLSSNDDNGHNIGCKSLQQHANSTLYRECKILESEVGFDFVDGYYYSNIYSIPTEFSHNPEWMVYNAQKFMNISVNEKKQPFFLYFAPTLTHEPDFEQAMMNFSITQTPNGDLTNEFDAISGTGMRPRHEIHQQAVNDFINPKKRGDALASIWIDDALGAMINYMENELGILDDTIFIVTNDHGMGAKGMLYEMGTRIPLFIRYPRWFPLSHAPYILPEEFITSNVDWTATIIDELNITLDEVDPDYELDGISWLDDVKTFVDNKINNNPQIDYTVNPPQCCTHRFMDIYNSHGLVTKDYKYIYRASSVIESDGAFATYYANVTDEEQFYDFATDPSEQNNIFYDSVLSNDAMFEMQYKVVQHINRTACIAADPSLCKVPPIDPAHIPPEINYNPPTPAPTPLGFECSNGAIEYEKLWKKQFSFDESLAGEQRRVEGLVYMLQDNEADCGLDPMVMEYYYDFEHIGKELYLDLIVCCPGGAAFGENYVAPPGFTKVQPANIWEDIENNGVIGLKEIIAINVALIIAICCCIAGYLYYNKKQTEKKLQGQIADIVRQEVGGDSHHKNTSGSHHSVREQSFSSKRPSIITSVELGAHSDKTRRESIVRHHGGAKRSSLSAQQQQAIIAMQHQHQQHRASQGSTAQFVTAGGTNTMQRASYNQIRVDSSRSTTANNSRRSSLGSSAGSTHGLIILRDQVHGQRPPVSSSNNASRRNSLSELSSTDNPSHGLALPPSAGHHQNKDIKKRHNKVVVKSPIQEEDDDMFKYPTQTENVNDDSSNSNDNVIDISNLQQD